MGVNGPAGSSSNPASAAPTTKTGVRPPAHSTALSPSPPPPPGGPPGADSATGPPWTATISSPKSTMVRCRSTWSRLPSDHSRKRKRRESPNMATTVPTPPRSKTSPSADPGRPSCHLGASFAVDLRPGDTAIAELVEPSDEAHLLLAADVKPLGQLAGSAIHRHHEVLNRQGRQQAGHGTGEQFHQ